MSEYNVNLDDNLVVVVTLPETTVLLTSNAPGPAGPIGPAAVADLAFAFQGNILAAEDLIGYVLAHSITFDQSLSRAKCSVAPTGIAVFTIKRNGASIGTVTFGIGSTTGTVALTSSTASAGDIISITGPTLADLSLSTVMVTIAGAN